MKDMRMQEGGARQRNEIESHETVAMQLTLKKREKKIRK